MPPHRQQGNQPPFGAAPSKLAQISRLYWVLAQISRLWSTLIKQSVHHRVSKRMVLKCKVVMAVDLRGLSSSTPNVSMAAHSHERR